MRLQRIGMVLIVAPVSVLSGWYEEATTFLSHFVGGVHVLNVHSAKPKARPRIVRTAWKDASPRRPHVIITSWGLIGHPENTTTFSPRRGQRWDYVILDEAHMIKNPKTMRTQHCRKICDKATKRLLLTGTPFQNGPTELWAIVNMATAGKVLGTLKDFNKNYGSPIENARFSNATPFALSRGAEANRRLQDTLKPFMLRRLKVDFLQDDLPPKCETCVWIKPSTRQTSMYREKLQSNSSLARDMFSSNTELAAQARRNALQVLAKLRNLCGHPVRLLAEQQELSVPELLQSTALDTILNDCQKLALVVDMLREFKTDGHKTLLFSQSTQNLDILQHVLQHKKFAIARLDG